MSEQSLDQQTKRAHKVDTHFLPGVSFTVNGETVPAEKLCWAMIASCGCTSGLHMMTEDTITEAAAWKAMSGNAAMQKRDKARGFTLRMVKTKEANFDDCTHTPKWGYEKPVTPDGYSWATTYKIRTLHLVELTALSKDDAKRTGQQWEGDYNFRSPSVESLCKKADESAMVWSQKWYDLDDKVECSNCVKVAAKQVSA